MKAFDIAVVGAGPAGATAGRVAAAQGLDTVIIEEHPTVGEPAHCGGLFSLQAARRLHLTLPENTVLHRPDRLGIRIDQDTIDIPKMRINLLVLDRAAFDRWLVEMAVSAGAELWTGTEATGLTIGSQGCQLTVRSGGRVSKVKASVTIGADGFRSRVGKMAGMNIKHDLASAIQYELETRGVDRSRVLMVFDRKVAPGGFAWVIPTGPRSARVGLAVRRAERPARELLEEFIRREIQDGRIARRSGHCIPVQGGIKPMYSNRLLLAGDAAGQVMPMTGAGIATGMLGALLAGEVAAEAVRRDPSPRFLKTYQDRWERSLGADFSRALRLRRMLESIARSEAARFTETSLRGALLESGSRLGKIKLARDILMRPDGITMLWLVLRLGNALLV